LRTDTKLGALIVRRNLKAYEVASMAGISPRQLSEYTAGRKDIASHHIIALSTALDVPGEDIVQPAQLAKLQAARQAANERANEHRESAAS
jgi:transcriptional regulator with XRE-family HTH domain